MLRRLLGRKTKTAPPERKARPGLLDRIKAFFLAIWNWTILMAAGTGLLLCLRLAYEAWKGVSEVTGSEIIPFALMLLGCLLGAGVLAWQIWRGIQYVRRRPD